MNPNPQPPLGPVSSLTDSSVRVRSAAWPGKCHVTKTVQNRQAKVYSSAYKPDDTKFILMKKMFTFTEKSKFK